VNGAVIGVYADRLKTNLDGRMLRCRPKQAARLEYIDLPVNDFALLAAIGAFLRQLCATSRLGLEAVRARRPSRDFIRSEHARQTIVTAELQLGVRAVSSTS
jgi:hypothetical protein